MGKNLPGPSEPVLKALASHGLNPDGHGLMRWAFHGLVCSSSSEILDILWEKTNSRDTWGVPTRTCQGRSLRDLGSCFLRLRFRVVGKRHGSKQLSLQFLKRFIC